MHQLHIFAMVFSDIFKDLPVSRIVVFKKHHWGLSYLGLAYIIHIKISWGPCINKLLLSFWSFYTLFRSCYFSLIQMNWRPRHLLSSWNYSLFFTDDQILEWRFWFTISFVFSPINCYWSFIFWLFLSIFNDFDTFFSF